MTARSPEARSSRAVARARFLLWSAAALKSPASIAACHAEAWRSRSAVLASTWEAKTAVWSCCWEALVRLYPRSLRLLNRFLRRGEGFFGGWPAFRALLRRHFQDRTPVRRLLALQNHRSAHVSPE